MFYLLTCDYLVLGFKPAMFKWINVTPANTAQSLISPKLDALLSFDMTPNHLMMKHYFE